MAAMEAGPGVYSKPCDDDSHCADYANVLASRTKCTARRVGVPNAWGRVRWVHASTTPTEDKTKSTEPSEMYRVYGSGTPSLYPTPSSPALWDPWAPGPSGYSKTGMVPVESAANERARKKCSGGADTPTEYTRFPDPGSYGEPILRRSDSAEMDKFWETCPWLDTKKDLPKRVRKPATSPQPQGGDLESFDRALQPQYGYSVRSSAEPSMPGAFEAESSQAPDPLTSSPKSRSATLEEIQQLRNEGDRVAAEEKLRRHAKAEFRLKVEQKAKREQAARAAEAAAEERKKQVDAEVAALRLSRTALIDDLKKAAKAKEAARAAAEEEKKQEDMEMAAVRSSRMALIKDLAARGGKKSSSASKDEELHGGFTNAGMKLEAEYLKSEESTADKAAEDLKLAAQKRRKAEISAITSMADGDDTDSEETRDVKSQSRSTPRAKLAAARAATERMMLEGMNPKQRASQPEMTDVVKLWLSCRERQQEAKDLKEWVQVEGEDDFVAISKDEIMEDASGISRSGQVVSKDGEEMADESEWEMDMS